MSSLSGQSTIRPSDSASNVATNLSNTTKSSFITAGASKVHAGIFPLGRVSTSELVSDVDSIAVDGTLDMIHALGALLTGDELLTSTIVACDHGGGDYSLGIRISSPDEQIDSDGQPHGHTHDTLIPLAVTVAGPQAAPPGPILSWQTVRATWESQGALVASTELAFLGDRLPSLEQARRRLAAIKSILGDAPGIADLLKNPDKLTPSSIRSSCELPYAKLMLSILQQLVGEIVDDVLGAATRADANSVTNLGFFTVFDPTTTSPLVTPALSVANLTRNTIMHTSHYDRDVHALLSALRQTSPAQENSWTSPAGGWVIEGIAIPAGVVLQNITNYTKITAVLNIVDFGDQETFNTYSGWFPPAAGVVQDRVAVNFPLPPAAAATAPWLATSILPMSSDLSLAGLRALADSRTESSGLMRATYHLANSIGLKVDDVSQVFTGIRGAEGFTPSISEYYDVFGCCRRLTSTPDGAVDCLSTDYHLVLNSTPRELLTTLMVGGALWCYARCTSQQGFGLSIQMKNVAGWGTHYHQLLKRHGEGRPFGEVPLLAGTCNALSLVFGIGSPYSWRLSGANLPSATPYNNRPAAEQEHLAYPYSSRDLLCVISRPTIFCPLFFEGDCIGLAKSISTDSGGRRMFDIRQHSSDTYIPGKMQGDGYAQCALNAMSAISFGLNPFIGGAGNPNIHVTEFNKPALTSHASLSCTPGPVVNVPVPGILTTRGFLRDGLWSTRTATTGARIWVASTTNAGYNNIPHFNVRKDGFMVRNTIRLPDSIPVDTNYGSLPVPVITCGLPGTGSSIRSNVRDASSSTLQDRLLARSSAKNVATLEMRSALYKQLQDSYHDRAAAKAAKLIAGGFQALLPSDIVEYINKKRDEAIAFADHKRKRDEDNSGAQESDRAFNVGASTVGASGLGIGAATGSNVGPSAGGAVSSGPPAHVPHM